MKANKPFCVMKKGSVQVPVYRAESRVGGKVYTAWLVRFYGSDGKMVQVKRADLAEAKAEALAACERLASASENMVRLTAEQSAAYERAQAAAANMGKSLELILEEYRSAWMLLRPGVVLMETVREYNARHRTEAVKISVGALVEEFHASKRADGVSDFYLKDMGYRLRRLAKAFQCDVGMVTGKDLADWLKGLGVGPKSRNNFRICMSSLFNYAKQQRYLAKDWDEMDLVPTAKEVISEILIFTPDELGRLLTQATNSSLEVYFLLGAFCGIRTAEIYRMDWADVLFDQGYVRVNARSSKVQHRRLVPIQENLMEWLMKHRASTGPIISDYKSHANFAVAVGNYSKSIGLRWKRNGLRHSYASYRMAMVQDAGKVSMECGHSVQKLMSNYRELVMPSEAVKWFDVRPMTGTVTKLLQNAVNE